MFVYSEKKYYLCSEVMSSEKPKYNVVAAVIIHEGEVLCVQKPQTKYSYTSFHWEYPGGKVEAGETEAEALVRELQEEMDYPIVVDKPLCVTNWHYSDFSVCLHFWCCHPASKERPRDFILKEHVASRWMRPADLHTLDWCAADCILPCLFLNQDLPYRDFSMALIPTVEKEQSIGVRTPYLRALARHLLRNQPSVVETFLGQAPHAWYEEQQLHAFLLSEMKNPDRCLQEVERFLPTIDNWATCDQLTPKAFKRLDISRIAHKWMCSKHAYTVRFGIAMFMRYCLAERFEEQQMLDILRIRPAQRWQNKYDIYYVRMMQAWYLASAMPLHWSASYAALTTDMLEPETRKMAIRKGLDSYRVSAEQKALLRLL